MHDGVQGSIDVQVIAHVVLHETESLTSHQVCNIFGSARDEIIEADDLIPLIDKQLANMAAKESGSAGYENAHDLSPLAVNRARILSSNPYPLPAVSGPFCTGDSFPGPEYPFPSA